MNIESPQFDIKNFGFQKQVRFFPKQEKRNKWDIYQQRILLVCHDFFIYIHKSPSPLTQFNSLTVYHDFFVFKIHYLTITKFNSPAFNFIKTTFQAAKGFKSSHTGISYCCVIFMKTFINRMDPTAMWICWFTLPWFFKKYLPLSDLQIQDFCEFEEDRC